MSVDICNQEASSADGASSGFLKEGCMLDGRNSMQLKRCCSKEYSKLTRHLKMHLLLN